MYDQFGFEKPSKKEDFIFGTIFVSLLFIVIYSALWLLSGFRGDTTCINYQKVIEVQASGGKQSYSFYYVRGESGGVTETRDITQIGEYICFAESTRNYYQLSPYITWWKGN